VTAEAFELPEAGETWGGGSECGAMPPRDGRVYWFATANRPEGERAADEHAEELLGDAAHRCAAAIRASAASLRWTSE
jgi:hypothetical protein